MKKKIILLALAVSMAQALVVTSPDLAVISDKTPKIQLTVINNGNKRAYVGMEAAEQKCPKSDNKFICNEYEKEINEYSKQITFSNPKFILDPGQRRNIFVFWEGKELSEMKAFLVGGIDHAAEAIQQVKAQRSQLKIELNITVASKMRVVVAPAKTSNLEPTVKRSGNNITITNNGTSPILLRYKETCNGRKCLDEKGNHLLRELPRNIDGKSDISLVVYDERSIDISYFDVKEQKWQKFFNNMNTGKTTT